MSNWFARKGFPPGETGNLLALMQELDHNGLSSLLARSENADTIAKCNSAAGAHEKLYAVIPWQMAIVARVLKILPVFLYDRLFANALRKPR